MKKQFVIMIIVSLFVGTGIFAQKTVAPATQGKLDFQFSPPEWQTAICLPDDPYKTLVDRSGELLYHYQQGGREFGTRISVQVTDDAKWIKQDLYSPRVPIVRTYWQADGLEVKQEVFAITDAPVVITSANILKRTDNGGVLLNWAKPASNFDPSLRNIAVNMGGNIKYDLSVTAGSLRLIAMVVCEGYWKEAGKRILKLCVEGSDNITIDPVAKIGQNIPKSFWFEARDANSDGKISISVEAATQATDKNTFLNGLWVFDPNAKPDDAALLAGKLNSVAQADIIQSNNGGPGRDDIMMVRLKNTSSKQRTYHPQLIVNTVLAMDYLADNQKVVVNNMENIEASLKMTGITEAPGGMHKVQLEPVTVEPGQSTAFFIRFTNGILDGPRSKSFDTAQLNRKHAIDFWEKKSQLPFDKVQIPDAGIQSLIESSVRNIWQAREIKNGLPAFQVGPTCYRGLWIVDGSFLLESAAMLGAGDQARNGVAYELTTQKPDGRIEVLAPDFWKENGLVLWTCIRHAQLTQDKVWLQSVWPKLQLIAQYIKTIRRNTLQNASKLDDGLNPAGTLDGGIGGTHDEYTNSYWNLTGLKAFIQAARWLGKNDEAVTWQKEYDDFMLAFQKAAKRDLAKDPKGNAYLPALMGEDGKKELPQRAQWAFCQAVYPGQLFAKDDALVAGNMAMLEATEHEGMVYGTGWDATGIWNYFASFYGHAWLWQGNGQKAAQILYAFGNHASPTLVWREEQSLKGEKFKKVGDMPHNWASAEFIRLTIHLLALDRGNDLHLFEGLSPEWTKPGMVTKLNGVATPFGALKMELKIAADGKSAHLRVEPLTDPSCKSIIVHLDGWTKTTGEKLKTLNPGILNELDIPIK